MAPRVLPLALVLVLTLTTGVAGLGETALALNLWMFGLVVMDFGASQWLLTRDHLSRREALAALVGRGKVSLASTAIIGLCFAIGWSFESPLLNVAFLCAFGFSFGQMSFAWMAQQKRWKSALLLAAIEYGAPVTIAFTSQQAGVALSMTMLSKTGLGILLTIYVFKAISWKEDLQGLPISAFGYRTSLWALTSFGSGVGELALLSGRGATDVVSGIYRVLQSFSSLGTIVGFAAQAPLMRTRPRGNLRRAVFIPAAILGATTAAALMVGLLILFGLGNQVRPGLVGWAGLTYAALALAAIFNSVSVAPSTYISRLYGSQYLLKVGMFSSVVYWGSIGTLWILDLPRYASLAVLLSSLVGLLGNVLLLRRLSTKIIQ